MVHKLVAEVTTWSMRYALKGKYPSCDPWGRPLTGVRAKKLARRLQQLAIVLPTSATRPTHRPERRVTGLAGATCTTRFASPVWLKSQIKTVIRLCFPNAAHLLTNMSHLEYLRSSDFESPWENMPGLHVKSCFRDPMHTIYLGTANEIFASGLGLWCRNDYVEGSSLQEQLRIISAKQKEYCKVAGLRGSFKTLTPSNTGLDKKSEYPELGSSFKAATVKTSIWFFAKFASEIASSNPEARGIEKKGFGDFLGRFPNLELNHSTLQYVCFKKVSGKSIPFRNLKTIRNPELFLVRDPSFGLKENQ